MKSKYQKKKRKTKYSGKIGNRAFIQEEARAKEGSFKSTMMKIIGLLAMVALVGSVPWLLSFSSEKITW